MKNEAFQILLDADIIDRERLFKALWAEDELELHGPWSGSDYAGDDCSESNQRSLERDYPELLHGYSYSWGHSEYGLKIEPREFGRGSVREEAIALAQILAGLKEQWPFYDEEDNRALIDERAEEAWDQYLRMDLQRELSKLTGADICLDDMHETFQELLGEHDIWPEAEGHRGVIFPGIGDEEFEIDLAKAALRAGGLDMDWLYDLTDIGYQLVGEWVNEDYPWIHPDQLMLDLAAA
jgi:hypothetical protein